MAIRLKSILTALSVLGSVWLMLPAFSQGTKSAAALDRDRIIQRMEEIQPTAKERRFDAIGWVAGLREAERLARESNRPVFLFSNVGEMDLGRC
jgi:hypothetical protein